MIQVSYNVPTGTTGTVAGGTTIPGYLVDIIDDQHAFIAVSNGTAGNYKLQKVLVNLLTLTDLGLGETLTDLGLGETLSTGMSTNGTTLGSIHRTSAVSAR